MEMEYTDRWHRLSELAWVMAEAGGRPQLAEAAQAAYRELVQPAPGSEWTTGCGFRFKHLRRTRRPQSLSPVP